MDEWFEEEKWRYEDRNYQRLYTDDDEYALNMPCDNTGMCAGTSCPNWINCKGE